MEGTPQILGASGEPSSPTNHLSKRQMREEMERLTTQLQVITQERNDLRDRLILLTEGSLDNRPYNRPNPFVEKLKKEHKHLMMDLQSLETEKAEASENLRELEKETGFYRNLQSRLLMEQTQLKKRVDMLRQENRKVQGDWALLKQICKDREESSDLQTKQQQELERLEETLQCMRKQKQLAMQQRDSVFNLKRQMLVLQMRSERLQHELNLASVQQESLLLQKEQLDEKPPAEPHPQQPWNAWDDISLSKFVTFV
ncbi:disks large homolog 5-like [Acomys russatus]|uniref:disks large homolog 5-like n=1 Tax=Acomys russatus TaxID=60746 RepID=UPI0021E2CD21|nr:disks large homolog 5-like [Acomys russatus]